MTKSEHQSMAKILTRLKQSLDLLSPSEQKEYRLWISRIERRNKQQLPIDRSLEKCQKQLKRRTDFLKTRKQNSPAVDFPQQLPISQHLKQLKKAIDENQVIIVAGETGSGKTTQLPKICLSMGRGIYGQIGHTQPRRLAARTVAARIAEELKVELGKSVGYQVRFDDMAEAGSYIKLMTDGILLNELHRDPLLKKYDTLIIDEAHERSLNIDFILGILHQLLNKRPDLKVIITSATIDPERFSKYFNNAPVIQVSGRTFPVETRYMPLATEQASTDDLSPEEGVFYAAEELIAETGGDILVFLPGERDIRHLADYLKRHMGSMVEVLPLYSRLAQSDQMKIFSPRNSSKTRIILATNVAETSLTVPGIHNVIDTGKARISRYSVRSKIQRLPIESISQASANQRKGRCGRVADGICIRLFSEDDFNSRQEFTDPEIKRTNLASVILQMAMLELGAVEDFDFLEPPDSRAINDGYKLLQELGAMTDSRVLTDLGRRLALLPVDPKLGRILIAGAEFSSLNEILIITAAMSLPDPRERPVDKQQQADEKHQRFVDQDSDFIAVINLWNYFGECKQSMSWNQLRRLCKKEFLNFNRMREWREIYAQLKRLMLEKKYRLNPLVADYDAIHKALLTGLISQIGEKTPEGDYQSTRQNRFHIFPGSGLFQKKHNVNNSKWLLAGELVETQKLYARQVAKMDPAWVEEVTPQLLKQQFSDPYWSTKASRAMVKENLSLYGLIVIANRPRPLASIDSKLAHELFIHHALVENDYITRAAAIVHNRNCLEQVEAMEHRARRRDILVEQDYLQDFYRSKIPEHIHNGQAFEDWYRKLNPTKQQMLNLSVEELIREEAEEIDRIAFPETLIVNAIELELEYHFEPGAIDDGLHIILPIAYINQFEEQDFDWLVPGMLEGRIIALIRSLPKPIRRNFVPVPHYAKQLSEQMIPGTGSFIEQLLKQLKQIGGIPLSATDFDHENLAENLKPLFYLTDMDSGHVIDSNRSLEQLQKRHADKALDYLGDSKQQTLYEYFPDCGFEPQLQSKASGHVIELYSGMKIIDDSVAIKTFDNQQQAEFHTKESLKLLLINNNVNKIREMKRHLPELTKAELSYATLKAPDAIFFNQHQSGIFLDLFLLVCDTNITDRKNSVCSINSPEKFEKLNHEITQALLPEILEHMNLLLEIFRQAELLRKNLGRISSPAMMKVASSLQTRMSALMYTGFLSAAGWQFLHHYPRYLKSLIIRFERAGLNPQTEHERALIWDKWWNKYTDAVNKETNASTGQSAQLREFRWLIEEFHVSLFAQQLGTKKTVSEKRLNTALDHLS